MINESFYENIFLLEINAYKIHENTIFSTLSEYSHPEPQFTVKAQQAELFGYDLNSFSSHRCLLTLSNENYMRSC